MLHHHCLWKNADIDAALESLVDDLAFNYKEDSEIP